jgi:outer membrane phospholipase A
MKGLNQEIQIRLYVAPAGVDYNNIETKFQLSFKTKVLQSIFWGHGDLWLAYTQSHIGKSIILRHAPLES